MKLTFLASHVLGFTWFLASIITSSTFSIWAGDVPAKVWKSNQKDARTNMFVLVLAHVLHAPTILKQPQGLDLDTEAYDP